MITGKNLLPDDSVSWWRSGKSAMEGDDDNTDERATIDHKTFYILCLVLGIKNKK